MKRVCWFTGFTLLAYTGHGQPGDSLRTELLREVTVTANRVREESVQTAGSVSIISPKNWQTYQPRTVPEALLGTTGVFIQKTTHGAGSAFLRGLTGNQTLILIDGIRFNTSTFRYGPNQYLNTVDPFTIDKIDVLRGGGSVAYGSDALGGTIQLLTRNPVLMEKPAFHGRAVVRYATGDMEKTGRVEGEFSSSRVAVQVGISLRNFGDLIGGDSTGRQAPSGYKELDFDGKVLLALRPGWTLKLAHQSVRQQHVPLYYRIKLENYAINEFDPQQRRLSYGQLNGKTRSNWARELTFTGSWQTTHEGRVMRRNGSSSLRTETDNVQTVGMLVNVLSDIAPNWTASSGAEIYNDVVSSNRIDQETPTGVSVRSRGLYPDNSRYLNYALYSLHQVRLHPWQLTFGGRLNGFRIAITDDALGSVRVKPRAFVGTVALTYAPTAQSNLYASFQSGFRAPNIDDMGTLGIVDFRYELPAYELKPEKSRNVELGYKLRTTHFALSTALFHNSLRDLITRVPVEGQQINGINVYRKENVERAYIRGAEAEAEYVFGSHWKAYGAIAYAFGQNVTKNEPVRRIPPLNGRLGLEYRSHGWYARPEGWFAGKQDRLAAGDLGDNRIPKGGTPGWAILNFLAGYETTHFLINAVAQNLTNADYRTHGSGINGVGRSVWITLTGKF